MKNNNMIAGIGLAALILVACGRPESEPAEQAAPPSEESERQVSAVEFRSLLADPARSAEDQARDETRRPADVLSFLGIETGMSVIDVIAAGGYYTEVLARAVGPDGRVVAQNPPRVLEFRDGANEKAISARLADDRLPNVTRVNKDFAELGTEDGTFDAAITALNFHDVYNNAGPEGAVSFLRAIGSVLRPGGVFGIIDHVGVADADNAALHRIEKSKVIEAASEAGFIVEDESDLLRNDTDDHSEMVFAEGVRGKTDRFLLKLRKPES